MAWFRAISRLGGVWRWNVEINYELRKDVLELKASQDGLAFSDDVLEFIANNVTDSIRELEGVVVSLPAHAMMLNQEISVDGKGCGCQLGEANKRQVTFELIAEKVANHCNIDSALLYGQSRKREISDARQLLMYFAKKGNATVANQHRLATEPQPCHRAHACKQIEQRITVEKSFQEEVQKILEELHQ